MLCPNSPFRVVSYHLVAPCLFSSSSPSSSRSEFTVAEAYFPYFSQAARRPFFGQKLNFVRQTLTVNRVVNSKSANKTSMTFARLEMQRKMQALVNNQPMDAWDKCWVEGAIPWDIGYVTPIVSHLIEKDLIPYGRTLVPGCGAGYDVVALANHKRYVVGVDISETAIKRARELVVTAPNAEYFEYLKEDFFTWAPPEQFDFIFDYTFFCAFEPQMRPAWAKRVAELLKPDGELLTLMFPVSNHEGGPPYAVSVLEYEKVLHPFGFKAISIENNEMAIEQRKGREVIARWKREDSHLSLL